MPLGPGLAVHSGDLWHILVAEEDFSCQDSSGHGEQERSCVWFLGRGPGFTACVPDRCHSGEAIFHGAEVPTPNYGMRKTPVRRMSKLHRQQTNRHTPGPVRPTPENYTRPAEWTRSAGRLITRPMPNG